MGEVIPEDSIMVIEGDATPKVVIHETPLRASFRSKHPPDLSPGFEPIWERNGSVYSSSRFDMKYVESRQDLVVDAVPPDGGWGWVVVAASFYCCAVIDGFSSVVGILLPKLIDHYEGTSASTMALSGSLYAGMFLLSGIVASCSINKLGCKATTIIGSLVTTASFLASTFAPSEHIFILLFGVCGGFGMGFVYLPASVMVNYYFYHRRGLANGISCSGSGAGILILSPLADFLAEYYGWKGCLIIMAGVALQCVACGALMRPLNAKVVRCSPEVIKELQQGLDDISIRRDSILIRPTFKSFLDDEEEDQTDDRSKVVENDESLKNSEMDVNDVKGQSDKAIKPGRGLVRDLILRNTGHHLKKNISSATRNKKNGVSQSSTELASWAHVHSLSSSSAMIFRHQPGALGRRARQTSECISLYEHRNPKTSFSSINDGRHLQSSAIPAAILENIPLQLSQGQSVVAGQVEVPPLKKIDIFYSGSIATLTRAVSQCPGFQSSAILNGLGISQYLSQEIAKPSVPDALEIIPEKEPKTPTCPPIVGRIFGRINQFLDLSLLANIPFIIISVSSIFIQLGFFIPILFLSDHAQKLGLTAKEGAILLSVLGGANMIGRALAGGLATVSCFNVLHLNCLSLIVSGLLTGFVFAFTNFVTLIFYSALFGLFVGW